MIAYVTALQPRPTRAVTPAMLQPSTSLGGAMTYQQPGQQWGAPPPPAKKSKAVPIILGVVSFIVVLGVIGAVTGKKDDKTAASPSTTATVATTQPAGKPSAAPKPKPAAKTVLSVSGTGIKSTARFEVEDDWDLQYSYDCSAFGMQGNFVVSQGGGLGNVYLNELGKKGADVTHLHEGGSMYLEINSECSWTIKAIDVP